MVDIDTRLDRLAACALDLETTGLDVTNDRAVSVGALGLSGAVVDREHVFETLVNPGLAIPRRSSGIHGITDDMVAASPSIGVVLPQLIAFIADRVVVGYNIGFDLAVLEAEAARAGMTGWQAPVHLDTGHLAARLFRGGLDTGLSVLADRLGVAIVGRHSALGDAMAAADIWAALIPLLQIKGVETIGAARSYAAKARGLIRNQRRAGWVIDG